MSESNTLELALAEAVAEESSLGGLSPTKVAEFIQHRDLLDTEFWAAWDHTVVRITDAYEDQRGPERIKEMRHEMWEHGWHRAADEASDAEVPRLYAEMNRLRTTVRVEWPAAFVYVVMPTEAGDEPVVFYREEDAKAFSEASGGGDPFVTEEPIIGPEQAKGMIADHRGAARGWNCDES